MLSVYMRFTKAMPEDYQVTTIELSICELNCDESQHSGKSTSHTYHVVFTVGLLVLRSGVSQTGIETVDRQNSPRTIFS